MTPGVYSSPSPVPVPQGVPIPQGVPMAGSAAPSAYGPAPISSMPPIAHAMSMAGEGMASLGAPGAAANALIQRTVGQNGYGVRPELTHEQLANILMPSFKNVESSNDYTNYIGKAKNTPYGKLGTASGAYGYTEGTWDNYKGYPRAMDAPPEIQDERMKQDLIQALNRYGGDPFKAAVAHFDPALARDPSKWNSAPIDKYGKPIPNALTPAQYLGKVLPPNRVASYMASVGGSNAQAPQ